MIVVLRQFHPSRRQSGRGLVEVLVVAVLTVVLFVVLTPNLGPSPRGRVLGNCQANLQKVYLALSLYQNDNNGAYPLWTGATNPAQPLSLLVPKSTTATEIFICPGSDDPPLPEGESFAGRKISYAYYMGRTSNDDPGEIIVSDAQVDAVPKSIGQQLFSSNGRKPGNNHGADGGNLLTRGGEVVVSGPKAGRDLRFPASVTLLNPQ